MKTERRQIENHASNLASLSNKEKTGSCGPVITVTAEWSVHGFAEPKKSSEEETHTLETLTTNDDESIFTTVTKCHKKGTHSRAPTRAPTDAPRQTLHAHRPPPAALPQRRSPPRTSKCTHSNAPRQIPTKGILPTHDPTRVTATSHHSHCHLCHIAAQARSTDNINASNIGACRTRS
jgi:hypothetical protein